MQRRHRIRKAGPVLRPALLGAVVLVSAGCASQHPQQASWKVESVFNVSNADRIGEAHYAIGRQHDRVGAWHLAAASYRKAVAADPQNVEAHNALGVALSRAGRHEEAQAALREALALDPERAHLRSNLGNVLLRAGRTHEAIVELKQAVLQDPRDAVALANLRLALSRSDPAAAPGNNAGPVSAVATLTDAPPEKSPPPSVATSVSSAAIRPLVPGQSPAPALEMASTSPRAQPPMALQVIDVPTVASLEAPTTLSSGDAPTLLSSAEAPRPAAAVTTWPVTAEAQPPSPAFGRQPRIEISNGNGVTGMAARLGAFLRANGLVRQAVLSNASSFTTTTTVVQYRPGFRDAALRIAAGAPYRMELAPAAEGVLQADIRVVLGRDVRAAETCGACTKAPAGAATGAT